MSKVLICGKAPSLLKLKGRSLDEFDIVVRVNDWYEIEGIENRCDAWVCYPPHQLGLPEYMQLGQNQEKLKKINYDLLEYAKKTREIWLAHTSTLFVFQYVFKKQPDKMLSQEKFDELFAVTDPHAPNTGTFAIKLAMQHYQDITIVGFDFYEGEITYAHTDKIRNHKAKVHDPQKDKKWVLEQIEKGRIKWYQ